jgi:hypothetical protein
MLTLAAFVAFMLVSPGVVLSFGIRFRSKYDLRIESENATIHVVALIILTTIIQIITVPAYVWFVEVPLNTPFTDLFWSTKDTETTLDHFLLSGSYFNYQHWAIASGYVLITYALSFLAGYLLIIPIERGCYKKDFFHGPLYDLITMHPRQPYFMCTVVTKVSNANSKLTLMYVGHLKRIIYEGKHKIKYVVLSHVYKFALVLDGKTIKTLPDKTSVIHKNSYKKSDLLYVDGSEISNILFSPLPLSSETLDDANKILFPTEHN